MNKLEIKTALRKNKKKNQKQKSEFKFRGTKTV